MNINYDALKLISVKWIFRTGASVPSYQVFIEIRHGLPYFAQWAEDHGGYFTPAKGDGSCGFNAVSLILYGHERKSAMLRRQSVSVQEKWEKEIFQRTSALDKIVGTAAQRRFTKSQPNTWFDTEDAMALSIYFQVKIVILGLRTGSDGDKYVVQTFPHKSMERVLSEYPAQAILYLFHHTTISGEGDHFDAFVPSEKVNVSEDIDDDISAEWYQRALNEPAI